MIHAIHAISSAHINTTRGSMSSSSKVENQTQIRRQMRNKLRKLLQTKFSDSQQDTEAAAKVLEEMLFRSANTFSAYQDMSTLESRIRIVVTVKLQRRMMQAKRNITARQQALQKCLQEANYSKAANLVQEIQLAKNKKVATMKCSGGQCSRGGPSFKENFPLAVRNLFFNTALIDAFEKAPVQRLSSLDWDTLIQVAEKNLDEYKESSYSV